MSSIVIIADDLTGANANGSLLVAKGFTAATCLSAEYWDPVFFSGFDAISFNADSRLLPAQKAYNAVYDAMRTLIRETRPVVMAKRIDSTLRGNMGREIDAALRAIDECAPPDTPPSVAVVVPAFPKSLRFAVGGYLLVNGAPLEETSIAKDPVTPLDTSEFATLIARQTTLPIGYVPLRTVLNGPDAVAAAITALQRDGRRVICCDAVTDGNIAVLATALLHTEYPILAVDPGPFTAALADVRLSKAIRHEQSNRVLAIVGSATDLVRRQMESLKLARHCVIERVDCMHLIDPAKSKAAVAGVVSKIANGNPDAEVFGVCTVEQSEHVLSLEDIAAQFGISFHEASLRINTGLAEIAAALLPREELRFGGLYTTGGEVTVAVARRLKALGFSVRNEVIPLAVYGRLIGGEFPELPMVTKGGFVGDASSVVTCIDYLFTKTSTRMPEAPDKGKE